MGDVRKKALLSVYDKKGIAEFAGALSKLGWEIYASGGTAKTIKQAGIEVEDVASLVGGSAILGHRVVTLSREIHAGLLADTTKEHQTELEKLGIPHIDLVCVDVYPLEQAIGDKKSDEAAVKELTDIGGPALLRSAAKGRRIVLSQPDHRGQVIKWLQAGEPDKADFLRSLAAAAELEVARYALKSAEYLYANKIKSFVGELSANLHYGENPWQEGIGLFACCGEDDPLSLAKFKRITGRPLSYTNYTDVDRLLQTITHIAAGYERNFRKVENIVLGAKHGNVCGAAVSGNKEKAIKNMLEGDPRAIFGGAIICNFKVEEEHARLLKTYGLDRGKRLIDILIAPSISSAAQQYLTKGKIRILANQAMQSLGEDSLDAAVRCRYIRGGMLVQGNYTFVFDHKAEELHQTGRLKPSQIRDMVLAWAIGSTSNSNTISIVRDDMLLGNGVGQQDRVSAAQLAVNRAKEAGHAHQLAGATAYSDSFFPFPDAPESLAKAGISAILATSGSVKDREVTAAMKKIKVAFYTLPDAAARGFYAH